MKPCVVSTVKNAALCVLSTDNNTLVSASVPLLISGPFRSTCIVTLL